MNATQVKNTVLASEMVIERLRSFRTKRLDRIRAGEGEASLVVADGGTLTFHLLPISAFGEPPSQVELRRTAELCPTAYCPFMKKIALVYYWRRGRHLQTPSSIYYVSPANTLFQVGDAGFEPATSSLYGTFGIFATVPGCSKTTCE
jgi:hypothetical protein